MTERHSSVSLIDYLDSKIRYELIQRFVWLYVLVMSIPYSLMLYRNLVVDFNLFTPAVLTFAYLIVILAACRVIPVSLKALVRIVGISIWAMGAVIAVRNANMAFTLVFAVLGALLFSMTMSKTRAIYLVALMPQSAVLLDMLYFKADLAIFVIATAVSFSGLVVAYLIGAVVDLLSSNSIALKDTLQQRDALNQKLEGILEQQKNMFAVIGHELRTPLASIEMVTRDSRMPDAEKIPLIADISGSLLLVLEDLRTVISPEHKRSIEKVSGNPVAVIDQAVAPLSLLLEKYDKQLHLNLDEQCSTSCCFKVQALRQLTTNLTKNSAIHSAGQNIWISLQLTESDGDNLGMVLTVEDDGRGIPEDQVADLFGAFKQGDTDQDGSGLGLFIAKGLAEELEGDLSYQPSQYGGACFRLSFKIQTLQPEHSEFDLTDPQILRDKRILFAEDNAMLRSLTENILTDAGASVVACADGQQALESYQEGDFDLILTDIFMPEIDGCELTRRLRAEGCQLPIIGISAAVIGEGTDKLITAGADGVIMKPISLKALVLSLAGKSTQSEKRDETASTDTPPSFMQTGEVLSYGERSHEALADLPLTDLDTALARMGMEEDVFVDVFDSWKEGMAECLNEVDGLQDREEMTPDIQKKLRLQIHSIKGMSSAVGANQLQTVAAEIEHQLSQPDVDPDCLKSDLRHLKQLYSLSLQEISTSLQQNASS